MQNLRLAKTQKEKVEAEMMISWILINEDNQKSRDFQFKITNNKLIEQTETIQVLTEKIKILCKSFETIEKITLTNEN